jgi:hypothetical protein
MTTMQQVMPHTALNLFCSSADFTQADFSHMDTAFATLQRHSESDANVINSGSLHV